MVGFKICNARECNVKFHPIEKFSIACQNCSGIAFFAIFPPVNGVENAHHPLQPIRYKNKNKSRLGRPRSPALSVVGLYNLCSHRLLIMWFWFFESQLKTALKDVVMMMGFRLLMGEVLKKVWCCVGERV